VNIVPSAKPAPLAIFASRHPGRLPQSPARPIAELPVVFPDFSIGPCRTMLSQQDGSAVWRLYSFGHSWCGYYSCERWRVTWKTDCCDSTGLSNAILLSMRGCGRVEELGDIAREWFEVMRGCGDEVRELLHDGCPVACLGDAPLGM